MTRPDVNRSAITVVRWSGVEVRALRAAQRLNLRDFAAQLRVSERIISRWEAGGALMRPRPVNQAALDAALAQAGPAAQLRFAELLAGATSVVEAADGLARELVGSDGRPMVLVPGGVFLSGPGNEPVRVDGFYIAAWAGKRLVSAVEWEKAARGPRGYRYPWGNDEGVRTGNFAEDGRPGTTPVDAFPGGASGYGVRDLCGNVWEWTATAGGPGEYVCRGGAYWMSSLAATATAESRRAGDDEDFDVGFRCAADLPVSSSGTPTGPR